MALQSMTLTTMNPFEELLEKLARAEVRFVLVGGAAVVLQGYARNTQDMDIVVEASEENARRLIGALTHWGAGAGAELRVEEFATLEQGAIRVIEDFPLDVFTLMRARGAGQNLTYAELATDALPYELLDGSTILFASIPKLLALKAGTGRPKDQIDAEILTEIARGLRERLSRKLPLPEPGASPIADSDQGEWRLASEDASGSGH